MLEEIVREGEAIALKINIVEKTKTMRFGSKKIAGKRCMNLNTLKKYNYK